MIYKVYTNNGERLTLEADYFTTNGSGTVLYKEDGGIVASFYCGEAVRVFPEAALDQAETE